MGAARKFPHEEAQALYASGEKIASIARRYDVTSGAIRRVVDWRTRARMDAASHAFLRRVSATTCIDCGGPCVKNPYQDRGIGRCRACAAAIRATSVGGVKLRCATCKAWKADNEFGFSTVTSPWRRGRAQTCRTCQTKLRQAYRERHKIPCTSCGQPCLAPNERRGSRSTGLCLKCYRQSLRK
jgi:hypothetical protein